MVSYTIRPASGVDLVPGPFEQCVGKLYPLDSPEANYWVANLGRGGSTTP